MNFKVHGEQHTAREACSCSDGPWGSSLPLLPLTCSPLHKHFVTSSLMDVAAVKKLGMQSIGVAMSSATFLPVELLEWNFPHCPLMLPWTQSTGRSGAILSLSRLKMYKGKDPHFVPG